MSGYRIFADESGTHSDQWLVIGMLFAPDHGPLHSDLCAVKEAEEYFNAGLRKTNARYKETHFAELRSKRDAKVAEAWIDRFLSSSAFYRSVVIDWSIFEGRYFGGPFDPEALKKRRAYKKWAEMLLQPELMGIRDARFYLDKLRILYGYDVIQHLAERFNLDRHGEAWRRPRIQEFSHTDSWKDANQCLQLGDLLTGAVYQSLVPSGNEIKLRVTDYLFEALKAHGVQERRQHYWRGYGRHVRRHFPKFSEWFWKPTDD